MLSFLRIGMTILGLTLILIGVGAAIGLSHSGRFTKGFVETQLEEIFSAEVELDDMRVLPLRCAVELTGLRVMNPEGFKRGEALTCERVRILLDPTTVFSEVRVVEELSFEGLAIYYRIKIGEGINIGRLAKAAEVAGEGETSRFVVKSLRCEDAEVHFSTNLIPFARVGVDLINIHVIDLDESRPISPGTVTSILLQSLLREIVTLDGLLDPIANPLMRELKELKEKLVG